MISATAILVPIIAALLAMVVKAAITHVWTPQALAGDFFFALIILLAPLLVTK